MILLGDNLEKLKELKNNSIDSVVTDPPYGLKFMNKKWDYDVPSIDLWREVLRVLKPGGHVLSFGGTRTYHKMVIAIEDAGFEIRDQIQWIYGSGFPKSHNLKDKWKGWGTALKPSNEPIVLARKPLEKGLTVSENVMKWGCGAINIDNNRIVSEPVQCQVSSTGSGFNKYDYSKYPGKRIYQSQGRWPANTLFDWAAAQMLDEQSGTPGVIYKEENRGASRFFYVAKVSKKERGKENKHPTVKPIKLMEYLIKLVTPPDGIVLDPFLGSGSTGLAAKKLGFKFIGIEIEKEYFEIAKKRMELYEKY